MSYGLDQQKREMFCARRWPRNSMTKAVFVAILI